MRSILIALFFFPVFLRAQTGSALDESAELFGKAPGGQVVYLHTLTNARHTVIKISDYGAAIVSIQVPDRTGQLADIVLGYDKLAPYLTNPTYFGVLVGRYGNRIAQSVFSLDGMVYHLTANDHGNSLHGGKRGFDKYVWKEEPVESDTPALRLSRLSPDGEEGYPGNLFVSVTYTLTDDNTLHIAYQATTDKPTVLNLTNHSYFNLAGQGRGTILNQVLQINGNAFTPVDDHLIPTGEMQSVKGTPYDFRTPQLIGMHLQQAGKDPAGYDINYVLNKKFYTTWSTAATVYDPGSGRTLTVETDQPGLQFYSGNFLNGTLAGKGGIRYPQYSGFALETQHYPDSPNRPNFPSTVLRPGETYRTETVLKFGVKN